MSRKTWLLFVGVLFVVWEGHAQGWTAGVDRSRSGEVLLAHEVQLLEESTDPLKTVSASQLSAVQLSAMGRIFFVPPAAIEKFRWGRSMAPLGHPLRETLWYTIWFRAYFGGAALEPLTLRVDRNRRIVEIKKWP